MTSPLAPTDEGAVAERLRERILVNFAPYDKLTHNLKLCLSFRGAERRGNPFSSSIMCIPLAVHRGCGLRDRCVHRSRNDRTLCCLFFSIMAADRVWRPLSPVCALGTVSLRLRGRRMIESAIREKTRPSLEHLCHCEASDRRHWPWQSVSLLDSSMFQYGVKEERIPTSLRSSE